MAIPEALTAAVGNIAATGAAVASLVLVARFLIFGTLFLGTPLEGVLDDPEEETDFAKSDKPSSDWYVLPAAHKREYVDDPLNLDDAYVARDETPVDEWELVPMDDRREDDNDM